MVQDLVRVGRFDLSAAFAVFDAQDSGCVSYGVEDAGDRFFVKTAVTPGGRASLLRAAAFHAAVAHPAIVRPVELGARGEDVVLVYPWRDGMVLNHATVHGSDRDALRRLQTLPVTEAESAVDLVLDAHAAVARAGFVSVDLYDGCFLYDFAASRMWLIDLDEYRPAPFLLDGDRLPGSLRYMAPEEFRRGAVIDERTMVFSLGRCIHHLLDSDVGWRGTAAQAAVVANACGAASETRFASVEALIAAWRHATWP